MIDAQQLAEKLGPFETVILRYWPCGCTQSWDTEEAVRLAHTGDNPRGIYTPCAKHGKVNDDNQGGEA